MKRRTAIGVLGGVAGAPVLMPLDEVGRMLAWREQVLASAGLAGGDGAASTNGPADGGGVQAPSLLTPERSRVMEALAEVIIPETDTPGASEAGVTGFVAALVDGWLADDDRDRFLAGLDTVDPACRERFGSPFAECAPGEQAAFVGDLDEELTRLREDPAADETQSFFHNVKRFTLTAYFTSEAGLDALGYRTTFRTFEGCAPLTPREAGR
ncbi:MAG: gluconate 2-dehydrogenase subunit 3 family protein [Gemmatimonadetes bacterium]|nr:gluconate 2-dehydrogenase subunit 3 family protein [Gemmatimonadota bacterium]MCY3677259.1 gluconate 2-dehydrogenase subunit 3 family protein [Gemmatimonadota bacterium]MYA44059.1 gluconate 2-dehydrogenase subunit 3 family protein [Gemmatimonadota bacterium]MYE94697.1 gluconate 2-dehydrogenase subunit 3 family protein [Gemmatimonadota bacterium]MYJ12503.1 gluconate 2-dehydrogenase subunit 3 family protein [Gemmatimonadota bacterium]